MHDRPRACQLVGEKQVVQACPHTLRVGRARANEKARLRRGIFERIIQAIRSPVSGSVNVRFTGSLRSIACHDLHRMGIQLGC